MQNAFDYNTGEVILSAKNCNPNPTTPPPAPPGSRMTITDGAPINWPLHEKCNKMDSAELESLIREANRVLEARKNARAEKLIDKVCIELNELKALGVNFIVPDCDGYDFWVMEGVEHFSKDMFKIK